MKKMTAFIQLFIISVSLLSISSCHHQDDNKQSAGAVHIITVKKTHPTVNLHYKGTLDPIKTESVISPVDGRISKIMFRYGQAVKKGQLLARLNSDKLADSFDKAVTDYFKQKNTYQNGLETWQASQMLYKAGINARSTYIADKSTQETNLLGLYQSRMSLEKILKQVNIDAVNIERMSIESTEQVIAKYRNRFMNIQMNATGSGVALYPLPNQDSSATGSNNSDNSGKLHVGSEVKEGQLLLSIGDLSGYGVKFNVSEIEVGEIKVGMPVTVTGDAFPNITLHGKIESVANQANLDQSGGDALSQFKVKVAIPVVKKSASKVIRVGMSCQIHLSIQQSSKLMIPLGAIKLEGSNSMVTKFNANGTKTTVKIKTGYSSPQGKVVVLKGLKQGDRIVVHD